MRRAFSTLGCPDATLDEVLALAAAHALPAVEIRALEGTVELPALFARRYGTPAQLAAHLAPSPVRIAGLGTSVRLFEARPGDREALLAFAPWAEAAGVPSLRVFDGGSNAKADELGRARDLLRWWRAERDAHAWAVDLIVETHDALAHPEAIARFLDALPDTALLWDAHHTWKQGGQSPQQTWALVRAHTRHIHVKDSVPIAGPRLPYIYVLPGDGTFPMAALRQALAADHYDGVLSLEWERMWHPDLPPLANALAQVSARAWW